MRQSFVPLTTEITKEKWWVTSTHHVRSIDYFFAALQHF
jgi:hypothetical protein